MHNFSLIDAPRPLAEHGIETDFQELLRLATRRLIPALHRGGHLPRLRPADLPVIAATIRAVRAAIQTASSASPPTA